MSSAQHVAYVEVALASGSLLDLLQVTVEAGFY